ncbi:LmbE-like protein [Polaromonas sp. CG9_12]|uniref:PIG-L deacetylase family protein n=1 Tax=Polaromonas sp. CG_9.11 TaxID=2787730 RepID=UPI0004DDD488|nr:PIG-L family deacetylase [Polaromonas sp. CG_9.11]MBG6076245.1 LmbE family N-acetylglucosaminyl deacetylase [Polaromonas sp. CG_9.11]CDS49373.1 LmbE-like protein [Polaromonas sp. CG9_12]
MGAVVFDRQITGQGTLETQWQAWPGLCQLPVVSLDELVPPPCRAVVVAPHPDDEVIGFGGLLELLAARGSPILVIALTDGEASHSGSQQWPPRQLAQARICESLAGLGQLGLPPHCHSRLSLPDGALSDCSEMLAQRLAGLLLPGDVVFSTWQLDGHPDHEAAGQATSRVCSQLGCRHWQAPVWMWHWSRPGDARVPWSLMRRLALPENTLRQKIAALAAHHTQLTPQDTGAPAVLPGFALARMLRGFEYFMPVGATA